MNALDEMLLVQAELALMEDVGQGDITTLGCIDDNVASAEIIAKSDGILAGLPIVEAVFMKLDEKVEINALKQDSDQFSKGDRVITIKANRRAIMTGERTALNFLGRLSGIASLTAKYVEKVSGTGASIFDTRKTTPGLRYLEKYAVICGGGQNHRYGLYDMVLIKDNHIASCGSVTKAVESIKAFIKSPGFGKQFVNVAADVVIEVEVVNEGQLREAIGLGVKRILLDNQSVDQLTSLVKLARTLADDLKLEASGNVNLDNVANIARTGVDYISIGALTHSAPSSDFSLEIIS